MKFYICEHCGEMVTAKDIDGMNELGGHGHLCYCKYSIQQWDQRQNLFQPIYFRWLFERIEISKWLYDQLKSERNTVLRLNMLKSIPKTVDLTTIGRNE